MIHIWLSINALVRELAERGEVQFSLDTPERSHSIYAGSLLVYTCHLPDLLCMWARDELGNRLPTGVPEECRNEEAVDGVGEIVARGEA
jgi:hypothetical protein